MEYVVYLEFVDGARYTVASEVTAEAARARCAKLNRLIDDGKARYMTRARFDA